ncbi:hypothetical protein AKJ60_00055 [candidate division MSBL1 archaeon SCGC-AAA385M11]|nr:hypothetical protein AKJ60_00055 [candidate division MSBL1 archaeon SCGC-AAA385M11]
MRLLIINTHPIHYHVPIYRTLNEYQDLSLDVVYLLNVYSAEYRDPDHHKGWQMEYDYGLCKGYNNWLIKNYALRPGFGFFGIINFGVFPLIIRQQYDAVLLFGYTHLTSWFVWLACLLSNTPVIFKGESDLRTKRPWYKKFIKELYVRLFFCKISLFSYSYKENAQYLKKYGAKDKQLVFTPCAVNNSYYQEKAQSINPRDVLDKYKLPPNAAVFLFNGRLEERKRPEIALKAFKNVLRNTHQNIFFIFSGDGSQKEYLKKLSMDYLSEGKIIFTGFNQSEDICELYSITYGLVLPSAKDPSPKVINEAMNFGIPVIVSDSVGTANDLVIHNYNGMIFDTDNVESLTTCYYKILSSSTTYKDFSKNALSTMDTWSIVNDALSIYEAVRSVKHE